MGVGIPVLTFCHLLMLLKTFSACSILCVLGGHAVAGDLWSIFDDNDVRRSVTRVVATTSDKNIDEALSKINLSMPSKIDGMTTLQGVKRADKTIIYEYVFNVSYSKLTIEARKDLRQKVIEWTCCDRDNVSYLRSGKAFEYKYRSFQGDLLLGQKVSARYCEG
jgi:hypothetical protein